MGRYLIYFLIYATISSNFRRLGCAFLPAADFTTTRRQHGTIKFILPKQPRPPSPLFSRIHGGNAASTTKKTINNKALFSASGLEDHDETAAATGLFGTIKKIHNPITYFVLGILAGFKWDWCFKSPIYWFAIGFTIKWYRARYVYKIPVWDRQPNWNNVITSKEQEKDLKAYTCKNCGSTIFIAKTREFFFEGNTGFGGLGCFHCGAKGKDNFVMDRDRIVDDVGDMDDYFEYERPLDFVSRAERRKLLKQTKGDEEKANQILLDRASAAGAGANTETSTESTITVESSSVAEEEKSMEKTNDEKTNVTEVQPETKADGIDATSADENPQEIKRVEVEIQNESKTTSSTELKDKKKKKKKATKAPSEPEPVKTSSAKPTPTSSPKNKSSFDLDGLEALDMDSF